MENNLKLIIVIGFIIIFTMFYFVEKEQQESPIVVIKLVKSPAVPQFKLSKVAIDCLAKNIYFEARSESIEGMVMVSMVTLNRVRSKHYPDSVCEVVTQGAKPGRRQGCQFSWQCDGLSDIPKNKWAWNRAYQIALWTSEEYYSQEKYYSNGATHYHTQGVDPYWNDSMKLVKVVGNHIFYAR